jgi:FtsH-binding integral membrane protein
VIGWNWRLEVAMVMPRLIKQGLNSDGRPHPVENVMAVAILLIGLVGFVLGMIVRNSPSAPAALHIVATACGLVSVFVGLYAQMVSATREQRVLIVTGIIAGFVGLALGLSHGGFTG